MKMPTSNNKRLYRILIAAIFGAGFSHMVMARGLPADLIRDQTLTIDGLTRTYDVYAPHDLGTAPRPLVVLLHGHMGDADVMTGANGKTAPYKIWLAVADREKLIIVVPDGEKGSTKRRGWNDCRSDAESNPETDDVAFIKQMINAVAEKYPVDRSRVYATGTSNGGGMTYRLALEAPDQFAAIAPVVAAMPKLNECKPDMKPVSVLIMNGTEDPILPFGGGAVGKESAERGETLSMKDTAMYWLKHNQIDSKPEVTDLPDRDKRDNGRVHVERYRGAEGVEVVLYEVRGGGHTEPSLVEHYGRVYKFIVGPQNRDIEMAEEIWKFFQDKHR